MATEKQLKYIKVLQENPNIGVTELSRRYEIKQSPLSSFKRALSKSDVKVIEMIKEHPEYSSRVIAEQCKIRKNVADAYRVLLALEKESSSGSEKQPVVDEHNPMEKESSSGKVTIHGREFDSPLRSTFTQEVFYKKLKEVARKDKKQGFQEHCGTGTNEVHHIGKAITQHSQQALREMHWIGELLALAEQRDIWHSHIFKEGFEYYLLEYTGYTPAEWLEIISKITNLIRRNENV